MRSLFIIILLCTFILSFDGNVFSRVSKQEGEKYSVFYARLTDRNESSEILKFNTENPNVKLFQAGDQVKIFIASRLEGPSCIGYVRDIEDQYMVVALKNVKQCWDEFGGLRRGAMVKIESQMLSKRIVDAGIFRDVLIKRKNDYLGQLKEVNKFLLNFKQYKLEEIAKIEKEIISLEEKKLIKVSALMAKRKDFIHLQRELNFRLDKLDEDIENYRLERVELLRDRWAKDQDFGRPYSNRPQEIKNWPDDDHRFDF